MSDLTETERTILLDPCACGHTLNDHGSIGCWYDDTEDLCDCLCDFEALLCERVGRIVAARAGRDSDSEPSVTSQGREQAAPVPEGHRDHERAAEGIQWDDDEEFMRAAEIEIERWATLLARLADGPEEKR